VNRRGFLGSLAACGPVARLLGTPARPSAGALLVPMDDAQTNHLKAYGIAYAAIVRTGRVEWLLNYRGGSFLLADDAAARRAATLAGVAVESVTDGAVVAIRGTIDQNNMDAIVLERAPRVAIYSPPFAPPWDDAVTMALQYAEIPFTKVWDTEVVGGRLRDTDWLHLHHEDFTGQYSKFYLSYAGAPWLAEMVDRNQATARQLGFPHVPALKKAVALRIRQYVEQGGFLFAMCNATETLELALAAHDVDIAGYAATVQMCIDETIHRSKRQKRESAKK